MIGNVAVSVVSVMGSMEVVEDEESGEPEAGGPEWVRDPCIHVIVIPGRRIVSDHWGTLIVIIVVNYIGI